MRHVLEQILIQIISTSVELTRTHISATSNTPTQPITPRVGASTLLVWSWTTPAIASPFYAGVPSKPMQGVSSVQNTRLAGSGSLSVNKKSKTTVPSFVGF
jgi:hypothetical protein